MAVIMKEPRVIGTSHYIITDSSYLTGDLILNEELYF
jgi:hypothetical protein